MQNQHRSKINKAATKPKTPEQKLFKPIFFCSKLIENFYVPLPIIAHTCTMKNNFFRASNKQKKSYKETSNQKKLQQIEW